MKTFLPKSRIQISVIIVNYNVREFLHQSIVSLKKSLRGIPSEIIVVDNASDDGSAEMVRKNFPGIRLIAMEANSGFAAANNAALKIAKGKYIFLLNPDTVVQEDTARVMLDFHGAASRCRYGRMQNPESGRIIPASMPPRVSNTMDCIYKNHRAKFSFSLLENIRRL